MSANGRLAASELTTVQGSIQLANDAAVAYLALHAKYPNITIAPPLGGYRSYAQQAALKANPKAYGSSLPSSAIASAGYSTHGLGENADLVGDTIADLVGAAHDYGFAQRDAVGDPHCFHYTGTYHPPVVVPATGERQVLPTLACKIHAGPDTASAAVTGSPAKAGTIHKVLGWRHAELVTVNTVSTDIWYKLAEGWSWAGGWTSQSTVGLTDLNPAVPPVITTPQPVETSAPPVVIPPVETTPVDPEQPTPPVTTTPTDPSVPSDPVTTVPPTTTGGTETTKPPTATKPDVSGKALGWGAGIVAAITLFIAWLATIGH